MSMTKADRDKLDQIHTDVAVIKAFIDNPCPIGIRNSTAIKWLYAFGTFAIASFVIVIKYFHGGK